MKIHCSDDKKIVAVCDSDLIGKKYTDGNRILYIPEEFFRGDEAEIRKILEELKDCLTANIVGNRIIDELIERNILKESNTLEVEGVKHTQIFKI